MSIPMYACARKAGAVAMCHAQDLEHKDGLTVPSIPANRAYAATGKSTQMLRGPALPLIKRCVPWAQRQSTAKALGSPRRRVHRGCACFRGGPRLNTCSSP